MRTAHIVLGVLVAGLGVVALVEGADLDEFGAHGVPGPGFFPMLIASALALLGLLLVAFTLFRRPVPSAGPEAGAPEPPFAARPALRVGRVWIGFLGASAALPLVGFIPAMALLVAYLLFAVERIRPLKAIAAIVLIPLLVYAVFAYLLGVALPAGSLFGAG